MVQFTLGAQQRQDLLRIARRALEAHLSQGERLAYETNSTDLLHPSAVFVTLRDGEQLRGCIGTLEPDQPLAEGVIDMAVAAATRDPRFPPIGATELQRLTIEISVLSARTPVSAEQVEVGKHGICISQATQRGILLPQVATEYGWDRETFLKQTCRKAGLPTDAWTDPKTRIEVFTTQIFSETEPIDDSHAESCSDSRPWHKTETQGLN